MYTVLTGGKKNVGDFLITDRSMKLLRHFKPDDELFKLPHWEYFDSDLDKINSSKAIIIMGGPGFAETFYPKVYKFAKDMSKIKVPIIPLGVGWNAVPGDYQSFKKFRFTDSSIKVIEKISKEAEYISVRDYYTKNILIRHGINNVLMTGCPVWYDIDSIGKKIKPLKEIRKIVFTPPQKSMYREQSIALMKEVRSKFKDAEIFCVFHRGIDANDEFTPAKDAVNNNLLVEAATKLNFKIVDAAFDLSKLDFYVDCDLHIGYRVHAHLFFIAKRKISYFNSF